MVVDWQHPVDRPGVSATDRNCPVAAADRTVAAVVAEDTDRCHTLGTDRRLPVERNPVPEVLTVLHRIPVVRTGDTLVY